MTTATGVGLIQVIPVLKAVERSRLIDCEEDGRLQAILVGMLRKAGR